MRRESHFYLKVQVEHLYIRTYKVKQYLNLLKHAIENGVYKDDRTGVGCYSIFGYQMRFNLQEGFPLITTKKLHVRSIIHELLWFLKGSTNINYLRENGVHIWDEWADERGELGPVYGAQWRSWPKPADSLSNKCTSHENKDGQESVCESTVGAPQTYLTAHYENKVDQIERVVNEIKSNPNSRRLIVSSWNVSELDKMALPPCHLLFQFYVAKRKLSCQLYQRSADIFLGIPFNIASYALLTHMVAHVCGLEAYEFIHTLGDAHIYKNHIEQVNLQLTRKPYPLPRLEINSNITNIFDFQYKDFKLINYQAHPHIKGEVAV